MDEIDTTNKDPCCPTCGQSYVQQAEIDELKSELGKWTGASANEYGQTVQRLTKAQAEIDRLKEEIDFLQRYGNKDCTAMAYEALGKHRGE